MKRTIDIFVSFFGIIIFSPIILVFMILIWFSDFCSPLYIAPRVGENKKMFRMVKLRSMVYGANKNNIDSTSSNDSRVTRLGKIIRKIKLDEITQLWNVLLGHMSLVGPRPNVKNETDLYTKEEEDIFKVKPGITDFSSIVFSDLGDIIDNSQDPNIAYNQLIRPWKSRLGILYVKKHNLTIDITLIFATLILFISKKQALSVIHRTLCSLNAEKELVEVCLRNKELKPFPPPGTDSIVTSRNI